MRPKTILFIMLIMASMVLSSFPVTFAQSTQTCEQCGMVVDATSQNHFKIVDVNGNLHYAECMMCALKLLKIYGQLNITATCDWYGPNYVISVNAKQNGSQVTVNPPNALVIAGGGCTKNRIVYNQTAASGLLANNGTSSYLAPIQKFVNGVDGTRITVAANSTIMTVAQAALQFGGGTVSPSPSPSPQPPASQVCEQCGMTVAADTQAHLKIVDGNGKTYYACCIKCAIKILTKVDTLSITTNCDWYGPNFPITVSVKNDLNSITVNPPTAMIIDGSCTKNRVAYDQTAANALLANNGSSRFLVASQNTTIPSNATIMTLAQAVRTFGASPTPSPSPTASPSPSASPTPTQTPSTTPTVTSNPNPTNTPQNTPTTTPSNTPNPTENPQVTSTPQASSTPSAEPTKTPEATATASPEPTSVTMQSCEVCGMDVNLDAQARYRVIDGNGTVHYVECFMCGLNLVNDYSRLHIVTCCDWYGPNYTITVDSVDFGKTVTVSPAGALFLNGGSCVINRAAYNQTAADALLANGYSQYTLPDQHYALPANTNVTLVKDAATKYAQTAPVSNSLPTSIIIIAAVAGAAVIAGSIVAYKKIKRL